MAKKITAPKTYKPSGGRPLEHLAYLNEREMDYLRGINGGSTSRGPRGLPSFAEDKLAGPSSSGGGRGPSGGGSSSTGGSGGKGGSSTSKSAPSTTKAASTPSAKFSSSDVMMTDANGTQYDFKGNVIKTDSPAKKSNSFASPNFPSSVNLDKKIQDQTKIKDAISAVKNTPAVKNDGVTGFRAQVAGVKPAVSTTPSKSVSSPKVSVGSLSVPAGHPLTRDMEVNRNLGKITEGFYKNQDFDTRIGAEGLREKERLSRESVGLIGKSSIAQPRDKVSAPARTAQSTGMTQGDWQSLKDKYNPVKAAGRAASAVTGVAKSAYSDPAGFAKSGIEGLGNYLRDSYNTISMASDPRYSNNPDVQKAAAEKAAEIAFNYGLTGSAGSIAGGVPKNSLGVFVSPSASNELNRLNDWAKDLIKRGATEEEIFHETARRAGRGISGLQRIDTPEGETWGYEVAAPLNVRQNILDRVDPSLLGRAKDLTFGKLVGENARLRDVVDTTPLDNFYNGAISNIPIKQLYSPSQAKFYKPSENLGSYNPTYNHININVPMSRGVARMFGQRSSENFAPVVAHETQHAISELDNRPMIEKVPQGTHWKTEADDLRYSLDLARVSMPEKKIKSLAMAGYWNNPGEILAQLAEKRRLSSPRDMKSFEDRIAAEAAWQKAFDHRKEINAIMRKLREEQRGWKSAWDSIIFD